MLCNTFSTKFGKIRLSVKKMTSKTKDGAHFIELEFNLLFEIILNFISKMENKTFLLKDTFLHCDSTQRVRFLFL